MMNTKENKRVFLVHWTYSPEEWASFQRWHNRRKGIWNYFLSRVFPRKHSIVPEVAITEHKIWIGDSVHSFRDSEKQLKRVHIRETGKVHIMELNFEKKTGRQISYGFIYVPVPFGKLREAMYVHESLSAYAW